MQCCIDEEKHTVTCAFCCDDSDCNRENCEVCHGGYCLTCFDQTDGHAPICAFQCVVPVSESDNKSDFCVQCCFDEQCGPCERCRDGWCEFVCDDHERCCGTTFRPRKSSTAASALSAAALKTASVTASAASRAPASTHVAIAKYAATATSAHTRKRAAAASPVTGARSTSSIQQTQT